jgi:hypothetical protein
MGITNVQHNTPVAPPEGITNVQHNTPGAPPEIPLDEIIKQDTHWNLQPGLALNIEDAVK